MELVEVIQREVEAETAAKKAAQPGIVQRYREHNNDQQRLYVCACCGERNKEATGKYTRVPLSALRYKLVSVSREKLTAAAVFEPQRSTLNDKTAQERGMCRVARVICRPHFIRPPADADGEGLPERLIPAAGAFHLFFSAGGPERRASDDGFTTAPPLAVSAARCIAASWRRSSRISSCNLKAAVEGGAPYL